MFLTLLQNRRSIRKYKNKAIDADTIDLLVEALNGVGFSVSEVRPHELLNYRTGQLF